jgi:hypothetical protein
MIHGAGLEPKAVSAGDFDITIIVIYDNRYVE